MSSSTITGTLTTPVTISSGFAYAQLTIAAGGGIVTNGTIALRVDASAPNLSIENDGLILTTGTNTGAAFLSPASQAVLRNNGTVDGAVGVYVFTGNTLINSGLVTYSGSMQGRAGVELFGGSVVNNGTISGYNGVVTYGSGGVQNTGVITGNKNGAAASSIYNSGYIHGGQNGASAIFLNNLGTISGGINGVAAQPGAVLRNAGLIAGGQDGISIANGSSIQDSGTIRGASYAIYAARELSLTVAAGAELEGKVANNAGDGTLYLGGQTNGSLDIGGSFSGFSKIQFYGGIDWTLEGSLTGSEAIDGFRAGDTLVQDGFTAITASYAAGIGLVLSNATATQTLAIAGGGETFTIATGNGNTTITTAGPPLISTISNTVTSAVSLGLGSYAVTVTVEPTGAIISANPAVYGSALVSNAALINHGNIDGMVDFYAADTLINFGSIGTPIDSAYFRAGGLIVNYGQLGAPGGSATAVDMQNATLVNHGTVGEAGGNIGAVVRASSGSYDTIVNYGQITGNLIGMYLNGATTLWNGGTIADYQFGISNVSNALRIYNSGDIASGNIGIESHGGVIENAGTISGVTAAIAAYVNALTLVADGGAVFTGAVQDHTGDGVLILGTVGGGSLGIGNFTGFDTIDFSLGAQWTLEGTSSQLTGGETIGGFTLGDTIILDGFSANADSFVSGTGLILSDGTITETLNIGGSLSTEHFAVSTNGTDTTITAACFCRGTRIATPRGGKAVEKLAIGDIVETDLGTAPIKWIGRRAYDGAFIAGNHLALPIKIRRHALGLNIPSCDVFLSPGHGVCEGGVFIPAWRLVNGVSITQLPSVEQVEYFHIELENPAVIFAENMPVESFVDADCRQCFQNAAEFIQLYPGAPASQRPCRPLIEDGFLLQRIQSRINARAGLTQEAEGRGTLRGDTLMAGQRLIGWAQDLSAPETPVTLEILHDGSVIGHILANRYRADLRKAGIGSGCHAFDLLLPPLPGTITLRRPTDGATIGAPARRAA